MAMKGPFGVLVLWSCQGVGCMMLVFFFFLGTQFANEDRTFFLVVIVIYYHPESRIHRLSLVHQPPITLGQ